MPVRRGFLIGAIDAGAAYLALAVAVLWPFTTDDAYISLQYGRSLAEGGGLAWAGVPVEGYSNFLFVLLGGGCPGGC